MVTQEKMVDEVVRCKKNGKFKKIAASFYYSPGFVKGENPVASPVKIEDHIDSNRASPMEQKAGSTNGKNASACRRRAT